MDQSQLTMGQRIAQAARAFEMRRSKHCREWVAVFMNEDTISIALHGPLTVAENALAQSPAGSAQVRESHRLLFSDDSDSLFREIESISGMEVRESAVEVEATAGGVVHVFTTATVAKDFPPTPSLWADIRTWGNGTPRRREGGTGREAKQRRMRNPAWIARVPPAGCVIPGMIP